MAYIPPSRNRAEQKRTIYIHGIGRVAGAPIARASVTESIVRTFAKADAERKEKRTDE